MSSNDTFLNLWAVDQARLLLGIILFCVANRDDGTRLQVIKGLRSSRRRSAVDR